MNYYVIIENKEQKYLKTRASATVIVLMSAEYEKFFKTLDSKSKSYMSFQKFLSKNGIDCVYDKTFGYINVDQILE